MSRKIKRVDSTRIDLVGKTFGDLTVVKLSNKRGNSNTLLWECECSCGKTIYLHGFSLLHDHYKSCGCKRTAKRDKGLKVHIKTDAVDGTRKSALKAKLHKGNKSGHKGVIWMENRSKWRAYIGFKGKQITLGHFENLDDAVKARKLGEEKYHEPILEEEENE